jgi:hypothetical protein
MKRFTGTEKWNKVWFQDLTPRLKCFWVFLCENADCAGVWEPNFRQASLQIGEAVAESDVEAFSGRVEKLPSGKFWIRDFLDFQYGALSANCPAHKPIFRTLAKHSLTVSGLPVNTLLEKENRVFNRVSNTLQETETEREKDKEKEGSAEGAKVERRPEPEPEPMALAKSLNEAYCALTGNSATLSYQRQQSWCEFIRRGFTEADLALVVRWLKVKIARNEGGFSAQSMQFGALLQDLDRFEDKLSTARASKLPGIAPARAAKAPPEGWQAYLRANYPDGNISTWEKLPDDLKRECREAITA